MDESRGTTPAGSGSPMRAATPGYVIIPTFATEDMKSASKNVMANESRPRILGGMPTILPPAKTTKVKPGSGKAAVTVPQSSRKTRSDTHKLPGKPERLIEQVIESTTKKAGDKRAPKKRVAKKAAAPQAIKPQAKKITKTRSPAKPEGKASTAKKAASDGRKVASMAPPSTTKATSNSRGRHSKPPTPARVTGSPAELVKEPTGMQSIPAREGAPKIRGRVATARKAEPTHAPKTSSAKTGAGVKKAKSTPMKKKAGATAATTTIIPIKRSVTKKEKVPMASDKKAPLKKKKE